MQWRPLEKKKGKWKCKPQFDSLGYHNDVCEWITMWGQYAMWMMPPLKNWAPLQTVKAGYPMQFVAVNILGLYQESIEGNSYIQTVADNFTLWKEAYPIPNQEAHIVAR